MVKTEFSYSKEDVVYAYKKALLNIHNEHQLNEGDDITMVNLNIWAFGLEQEIGTAAVQEMIDKGYIEYIQDSGRLAIASGGIHWITQN